MKQYRYGIYYWHVMADIDILVGFYATDYFDAEKQFKEENITLKKGWAVGSIFFMGDSTEDFYSIDCFQLPNLD